ncbi:nonsense-mediated mRNA decay factor SMG9 isoform X2 [Bacillus rossius redtenbacheri]|uniref:nonsense-mediated mRNA decay factor SMG9 isoform X2 n=1 Tax=Bacillus rossius redtenbacheri TaxID=93214 RepID=UPI002FDD57C9
MEDEVNKARQGIIREIEMSDLDRGRGETRPRKFYQDRREAGAGRRPPVIIARADRDRDKPPERAVQPTIILRPREDAPRPAVLRKDAEPQTPMYQLVSKLSLGETANPLAAPPQMRGCVKLLDESLQFCDSCLEYLVDQNDFIVVGVVGTQGVGKSSLMSWLAGDSPEALHAEDRDGGVFPRQGPEQHESGQHCTVGVDVCVTPDRMVLLDMQPVLSPAVAERLAHAEAKKFSALEFTSAESSTELQSMQLAAFLLSVCHVVVLVQDWFLDPNVLRFLQCAEMLKPATPTTSQDEEIIEYFPHVLFLHNRAQPSDFSPRQVQLMQNVYNRAFLRSRVQIQSGIGIASGSVMDCLNPGSCGEPLNLFLLPEVTGQEEAGHFRGQPGCAELVRRLRRQILGVGKQPLTHTVLSEKNWFHYAYKVWESVRKSSFFLEYSRLLP